MTTDPGAFEPCDAEDRIKDPDADEAATYRYGLKLTDGDVLWGVVTYELTSDQVLPKLLELTGSHQGRAVPSHQMIWDGKALRLVAADKILYAVLGIKP